MSSTIPLAISAVVLIAVRSKGRRGWLGGGHTEPMARAFTITNAEMNPANSMISTKTKRIIPSTPFETTFSARRGLGRNGMIVVRALISPYPSAAPTRRERIRPTPGSFITLSTSGPTNRRTIGIWLSVS